jgi:hypothetical protein
MACAAILVSGVDLVQEACSRVSRNLTAADAARRRREGEPIHLPGPAVPPPRPAASIAGGTTKANKVPSAEKESAVQKGLLFCRCQKAAAD